MTRFCLTQERAVQFVIQSLERMEGGEIFVPKIPSMRILDLAEAIAPGCKIEISGIRPWEKLHEVLLSEDEARHTIEIDDSFVIAPMHPGGEGASQSAKTKTSEGLHYTSEKNSEWTTVSELRNLIGESAFGGELKNTAIVES